MKYIGEYVYQVMPPVSRTELVETDIDKLVRGPYALSVDDILEYLESILSTLLTNNKAGGAGAGDLPPDHGIPGRFSRWLVCLFSLILQPGSGPADD